MSKLRSPFAIALVAAAALTVIGAASAARDQVVVGHVYVDDNTTGVNTIAGYDRYADGTLTPMPGSPFAIGGAGTGHATASQGALQESSDGRYLLAVDAGSNQISVLRIKPDGSLQQADLVSSNGVNPVSITEHHGLVYVANAGPGTAWGDTNYTGFTLNAGGHLRALAGSTVVLPNDSQPGDVFFNGDGTLLAGTRVNTSQVDSFAVAGDGRLTPAAGSPYTAQGLGPFGSEFNPVNSSQLFVANAHNGAGLGTVSSYVASADGTLTSVNGSPFANLQTAPCWVEISHDGNWLFAVNTASATISTFAIAGDGRLMLQPGATPFANGAGAGAEDARLTPDGSTLWVVEAAHDTIAGFSVDGGTLTELHSSPTPGPAGASPSGIVVT